MTRKSLAQINESIFLWINKIDSSVQELFEDGSTAIPDRAKKTIYSIQGRIKRIREHLLKGIIGIDLLNEIQTIINRAEPLLKISSIDYPDISEKTHMQIALLASTVAKGRDFLAEIEEFDPVSSNTKKIGQTLGNLELRIKEISSKLKTNEQKSRVTEEQINKISESVKTAIEATANECRALENNIAERARAADSIILQLKNKEEEVNRLVEIVSGTSIAGSYSESARTESMWANSTRNGSVFLMLAIALLVGYSLLETSSPHFDWQTAVFRLVFSVALSVPAVYLSRESSRHRLKQYEFQKTSLDLQSISPYLASLPEDEQHKLKVEMANRIFAPTAQQYSQESYPIDLQGILLKVLEKVPSNSSSGNGESKSNSNKPATTVT